MPNPWVAFLKSDASKKCYSNYKKSKQPQYETIQRKGYKIIRKKK